jgi:uncharacterized cupin superfamily protein
MEFGLRVHETSQAARASIDQVSNCARTLQQRHEIGKIRAFRAFFRALRRDMSSSQRHPCVANLKEVKPYTMEKGSRFALTAKGLGSATGAKGIGCTYYEQEPGKCAFPAHYHTANEESLFVLEGKGSVRIGNDWIEVGPGDYVTFPVGPEYAHQVKNSGETTLKYLCFSTKHSVEVVAYPDSKKIGIRAAPHGAGFNDPNWIRYLFEESAAVDYYHGEKTE